MKNRQRLKDIFISIKLFYREYTAYNLIFTFIGLWFLLYYGIIAGIWIFWIKILGYIFLALIYQNGRKKYFYFFHNLGINTPLLFFSGIAIDGFIAILIFSLVQYSL